MPEQKIEKRVVMARKVARRWIGRVAKAEYRVRILYGAKEFKNLTNLLRCFRDGKVAMKELKRIPDLGIREDFDGIDVWSSDHDALAVLNTWFEDKGFETSGVV
jgi:hypothetical protein